MAMQILVQNMIVFGCPAIHSDVTEFDIVLIKSCPAERLIGKMEIPIIISIQVVVCYRFCQYDLSVALSSNSWHRVFEMLAQSRNGGIKTFGDPDLIAKIPLNIIFQYFVAIFFIIRKISRFIRIPSHHAVYSRPIGFVNFIEIIDPIGLINQIGAGQIINSASWIRPVLSGNTAYIIFQWQYFNPFKIRNFQRLSITTHERKFACLIGYNWVIPLAILADLVGSSAVPKFFKSFYFSTNCKRNPGHFNLVRKSTRMPLTACLIGLSNSHTP